MAAEEVCDWRESVSSWIFKPESGLRILDFGMESGLEILQRCDAVFAVSKTGILLNSVTHIKY